MISESKRLVLIIFYGSKLIPILEDRFFKFKLYDGLINLGEAHINYNVAQYKNKEIYFKFKNSILNFIEILDYITHSNKELNAPLLQLKRRVILLNLKVLKSINKKHNPYFQKEAKKVSELEKLKSIKSMIVDSVASRSKSISSKDKILDFIRKTKKIRARDLVEQFSAFSGRTVKRTLKELTNEGVIKREEDEKAVYYSILRARS